MNKRQLSKFKAMEGDKFVEEVAATFRNMSEAEIDELVEEVKDWEPVRFVGPETGKSLTGGDDVCSH